MRGDERQVSVTNENQRKIVMGEGRKWVVRSREGEAWYK